MTEEVRQQEFFSGHPHTFRGKIGPVEIWQDDRKRYDWAMVSPRRPTTAGLLRIYEDGVPTAPLWQTWTFEVAASMTPAQLCDLLALMASSPRVGQARPEHFIHLI